MAKWLGSPSGTWLVGGSNTAESKLRLKLRQFRSLAFDIKKNAKTGWPIVTMMWMGDSLEMLLYYSYGSLLQHEISK